MNVQETYVVGTENKTNRVSNTASFNHLGVLVKGGSRKLFWKGGGHIGLEWPKTTTRDAECFDFEEMYGQGVYPLPSQLGGLGERYRCMGRGFTHSTAN